MIETYNGFQLQFLKVRSLGDWLISAETKCMGSSWGILLPE